MCHGPRGAGGHRACLGSGLAGRAGRHLAPALLCRVGSLRPQWHSPRAGARLCPLPPRCLGKADGEPWLQAMPQGWDSAIPQKGFFCLSDGAWRSREPLGTWLRQGVDGLCGGGAGPHRGCHPPSSCQVPLFPAARSSPVVFYEGDWVPASSFLNGSAPSRQGVGCAPGTASVGRLTLSIVWLPPPTPAPSSAKDTRCETMTG